MATHIDVRINAIERAEAYLKQALDCIDEAWGGNDEAKERLALRTKTGIAPIARMAEAGSLIERAGNKLAASAKTLKLVKKEREAHTPKETAK